MKGSVMKQSLLNIMHDESGAAAAEYALILAIVGAGIADAAKNLGTAISSAITAAQGNTKRAGRVGHPNSAVSFLPIPSSGVMILRYFLLSFILDESGAAAAEYALI